MLRTHVMTPSILAVALGIAACAGGEESRGPVARLASESVQSTDEALGRDPFVVEQLDLTRYVGRWFEIASIPTPQSGFCTNAQADYSFNDDGTVRVVNSCLAGSVPVQIEGKARVVDPESNAILAVSFGAIPGEADYRVIALDIADYGYALITNLERSSLFVLSREKTLDEATYQALLDRAADAGVDVSLVRRSLQTDGQ
jgi:apolipoprotein D and lipocalin family protein